MAGIDETVVPDDDYGTLAYIRLLTWATLYQWAAERGKGYLCRHRRFRPGRLTSDHLTVAIRTDAPGAWRT